ncbi:MAG: helix-turn-helix domain-containing protein [Methylobacter sp.]
MSHNAKAQCHKLLQALRQKPLSTLDARRELDILHPGARIQELKAAGHNIVTHWSKELSECGKLHRVARYVLLSTGA